jgi:predicted Zn-dependent protease
MAQIKPMKLLILALAMILPVLGHAQDPNQLPELGNSSSAFVSQQQEHQLGRIWLRQLRAQANTIEDPIAKAYIEDLIYRLAPHSEVQDSRFEFVIIDQAELNAFAVPGGIIGINAGIFLYARDEDELAAVMAHELAHLSQRHFARQVENAERQAPIAIASLLASILLIATNNPDAGFAGLVTTQAASAQTQLAYSRDWEREADRTGMKTLAGSGMDPHAMPSMFQQMLAANRYNERPPEFLLTHPVTDTRVSDAANRAESFPLKPRSKSFVFQTLQHRARIRYVLGSLPVSDQIAYFDKQLSKASDTTLKDALIYAKAHIWFEQQEWSKALAEVNAISPANNEQPATLILKANTLHAQGNSKQAIELLQKAYQLRPDSYALSLALANIQTLSDQAELAINDLVRWSEKRGTDPNIWKQLMETANKAEKTLLSYRARAEFLFLKGQKVKALRQLEFAVEYATKNASYQQQAALKERLNQMVRSKESLSL